jgi:hypothetical protein
VSNRSPRTEAWLLRAAIAGVLSSRSLLEPLTTKEVARLVQRPGSLCAVARARRWVEEAYRRDKLAGLAVWIARARKGCTD